MCNRNEWGCQNSVTRFNLEFFVKMTPMKFYYSDKNEINLPPNHRFPIDKYKILREELVKQKIITLDQLIESPLADEEDILRVHTKKYFDGIKNQTLDPKEAKKIGLPLTEELFRRSMSSVGGFLKATEDALQFGFSASLAGGTHHAHRDCGEGFCVFNDFAISCYKIWNTKPETKILIIDLDVHQGNGNSSILNEEKNVFIFSMHGRKNYPYRKIASHLDIELEVDCTDEHYLELLSGAMARFNPHEYDLIMYQAGVDALKEDFFGTLNLTHEGLRKRDQMVFEFASHHQVPLVMALGGGYSKPIEHSVQAYINTYSEAKKIYRF